MGPPRTVRIGGILYPAQHGVHPNEAGRLYPVEINSGSTVSPDMLDALFWWAKLAGLSPDVGTLVYGGDEAFTRNTVPVRPWFSV